MPFDPILVAIDGSEGAQHALSTAIELAQLTEAMLIALAVEGPLPAYAATISEVDGVKREKDSFFDNVAAGARQQADSAGVQMRSRYGRATRPS